jgi:hypothetical protein
LQQETQIWSRRKTRREKEERRTAQFAFLGKKRVKSQEHGNSRDPEPRNLQASGVAGATDPTPHPWPRASELMGKGCVGVSPGETVRRVLGNTSPTLLLLVINL